MRYANNSGAITLPSPTPTLTASPAATETATPMPTATETPTPQETATETATAVLETATETATEVLVPSETPTPSETPQPVAGGLRGVYYDNANLTALVLARSDAEVNFTWPLAPAEGVGADTFSVRWEGYVMPQYSETYTFYTTSDDGVRLWVNNQQLIDNWIIPSSAEQSGQIALTAGQLYPIRLEYYDNSGGAAVSLSWASATQSQEVIPAGQLYLPEYPYQEPTRTATSAASPTRTRTNTATSVPTQTAVQSATPSPTPDSQATGLKGEYFDNVDFTSLKVTRTDTKIDFSWTGAPATGVGVDSYSVRRTGYLKPLYSQTYTFYTTSDDGVRLWVNGELLIDNWSSHAQMDDSAQISLAAGRLYSIQMEMYDNTSTGVAKLAWSSISQGYEIIPAGRFYPPTTVLTATPTQTATRTPRPSRTPSATPLASPTPGSSPTPTATRPAPAPLQSAEYVYDGDGNLVKSVVNSTTTYFVGKLYQKRIEGGNTIEEKTYFNGGQAVAMRKNGTLYWLVGDHLGSTSLTANADGTLYSELRYSAYGEVRFDNGTTPTKFQYTGQLSQMDEIGLYYYVARFYDPVIAHFTQADSIVPQPGMSVAYDRFAYGLNNPSRYTDPTGHWVFETNKPEEEQRRNAYLRLAQKTDSLNGFRQEYYTVAAGYYHARATESSGENIEMLGSVLQNKANQAAVNGWNGTNAALDTAFRTSGMDVSQGIMAGGIGLYGTLKATNGLGLFDLLPDNVAFTTDEVLTLGQNFVGDNPLTVAEGVYVSSTPVGTINGREVYAQFRITDSDIAGHGRLPHANFEVVYRISDPSGRVGYQRASGTLSTHVNFLDLP